MASQSDDSFKARLALATKIARLFKDSGWTMIVVGEFALEYYTDGQCTSDEIDLSRGLGEKPIPATVELEIMKAAGGRSIGVRRHWIFTTPAGDVAVRLLGEIETRPTPDVRTVDTTAGPIQILSPEAVLVDWAFVASFPTADCEAAFAVQKMIAAASQMGAMFDWEKAYAIAASKEYGIEPFLRDFVQRTKSRR